MIYCQRIAIWGVDGHTMSYVFMCSLVNSSGIYYLRLNWEGILCTLKILIIVSCISFQQLEALKYDLNILLVNFFLQFLYFFETDVIYLIHKGKICLLWKCVCFCLYVSVYVGLNEGENVYVCVCVCMCVCAHARMCCSCNVN